jgi:exosortase
MAPLKLFVSKASAGCLQILGYDVVRQGNILTIGAMDIGVTDACSGLNSFMAIMTLSVFYGYLMIYKLSFRIIMTVAIIPLVMAVNIFRVTASSIMALSWGQDVAFGRFHYLWGVLVFSTCVLGLMALTRILARIEQKSNDSA